MQSSFNILSALFRLVNIPEVTGQLGGRIFIGDPPKSRQQGEDIGLNLINNPNGYLQSGYCNLNIYTPTANHLARLKTLTDIIIPLVEDSTITTENGTFHFQIDDDKGVFEDDRDGMSYYNLKLTFQTIK